MQAALIAWITIRLWTHFLAYNPEASCASTECHAWDTLATRYYQASDASLNLWVLAPVALVVGLVLIVRKVG